MKTKPVSNPTLDLAKRLAELTIALADKTPHFKGCGFYHAKPCDCLLLKTRALAESVKGL